MHHCCRSAVVTFNRKARTTGKTADMQFIAIIIRAAPIQNMFVARTKVGTTAGSTLKMAQPAKAPNGSAMSTAFVRGRIAAAAECARGQGRFWEYHDAFFRSQDALDEQALHRQAATLGLNEPQFADCLASSEVSLIDRDLASAKTLGVTGTPAFLIGMVEGEDGLRVTNILTGAQPASEFGKVLDDLLTGTKSVSQQR